GVVEAARHVDITDTGLQHVRVRYRWLRNRVANDVDVLDAFVGSALECQLDSRSTWTPNLVTNFERRLAGHRHTIDFDDLIAVAQSGTSRRRIVKGCGDVSVGLLAANVSLDRGA